MARPKVAMPFSDLTELELIRNGWGRGGIVKMGRYGGVSKQKGFRRVWRGM